MYDSALTAPIGSIQKFSVEDGPGIRTTVFLKGCPLACAWCHNPELISPDQELIQSPSTCIGCAHCASACPRSAITFDPDAGAIVNRDACTVCLACADVCTARSLRAVAKEMSVEDVLAVVAQDKGFYDNTGGGMTISGGEVLSHVAFAEALIDAAACRGITVCVDTSGFGSGEALLRLACRPNVTHVLYDVKATDPDVHKAYVGIDNRRILDNLRLLAKDERCAGKLVVRMPLIAGVNDNEAAVASAKELLVRLGIRQVDLLAYHALGVGKARNIGKEQREFAPPSDERLEDIRRYFEEGTGMRVGILGKL